MNRTTVLLTALALMISAGSAAKNIFASPNGTDNAAGTKESPYSITAALKKIAAEDSLFLMGGTYRLDAGLYIRANGNKEKRTFIGAYNGERPILDFRDQPHFKNGVSLKADYVHLKDVDICYAGYKGLMNEGSYCLLENLDVYGNCDSGIQNKKGVGNVILNCDSHDNFDYETGSVSAADWGGNADGFADKQFTNSPGNTYIGCRSWNNSDDGWDFYQRVGGTTVLIDCICYAMGPQEYDLREHPRRQTDKDFLDQFEGDGIEISLKNNKGKVRCSLEHFYNNGNANGFKLGGDYTKHDVTLYRCLAVGNLMKGFDQNNNQGAMKIYNATSYLNKQNYAFFSDKGYSLDIKNSVGVASRYKDTFTGSKITSDHNSWDKGFSASEADFQSTDTTLIITPRNADGSLPDTPFLKLAASSKLIDAGVQVEGISYNGEAPDLGCYETDFASFIKGVDSNGMADWQKEACRLYDAGGRAVSRATTNGITIIRLQSGKTIKTEMK